RTQNKESTSVLALERRTGRLVLESEVNGNRCVNCDTLCEPSKQTITLTLFSMQANKLLTFHFTDKPTPPEPPAHTGQYASNPAGESGTVDRTLGAALDLFNRSLAPRPPIPPRP